MDLVEIVTDRCIRRALGFAGLAIGMVMLSLSFDLPLALRAGADLVAVVAVVMLIAAWHAPRRDMRHSEAWMTLSDLAPGMANGATKGEMMRRLRETLRRRLVWHAERAGLLALALWVLTAAVVAVRAL